MNIQPSIDLKKVNLQTAVGYLVSLHENEYQWNLLGVKVIGVAATEADIPEGTYKYGDAYEVGTEPPYDLYIYTRPDGKVHTEGYWFNTGKFPMPGPQGPKGDGVETFNFISLTHDIFSGDVYGSDNGQTYNGKSTIQYKDSTTGQTKSQDVYTTVFLPIVGSDYINIDGDPENSRFVVRLDDTALALDYFKIDKSVQAANSTSVYVPSSGKTIPVYVTFGVIPNSIASRDSKGDCSFHKLNFEYIGFKDGGSEIDYFSIYSNTIGSDYSIEKTPTDTGTLTNAQLVVLQHTNQSKNLRIVYDNQVYYRMDPQSAPDGTLNYIHLDSIDDGSGRYKATGKCFSVTVSTRAWKVFDLDFGGSTRTTHNLTLTNNSTGVSIYFSLTNNRTETYEGAPAGLLAALENSPIACTVDNGGSYKAGMITVGEDNFRVMYGNSEEVMMTQAEVSIADSIV